MIKVCLLDYGSGNVKSVYNLVSYLGYDVNISNEESDIKSASHIILPGVGSYGSAMEKIKLQIPVDILEKEVINRKKPILGICVGMQVFSDKGKEYGDHNGLGIHFGALSVNSKGAPNHKPGGNNKNSTYRVHYSLSNTSWQTVAGYWEFSNDTAEDKVVEARWDGYRGDAWNTNHMETVKEFTVDDSYMPNLSDI